MEITTSWKEEGREEGLVQGRREGIALLSQLAHRCGPISAAVADGVASLPAEALDRLAKALPDFSAPADLERWLANERS
jgi:uncharacterized protein DUF4351